MRSLAVTHCVSQNDGRASPDTASMLRRRDEIRSLCVVDVNQANATGEKLLHHALLQRAYLLELPFDGYDLMVRVDQNLSDCFLFRPRRHSNFDLPDVRLAHAEHLCSDRVEAELRFHVRRLKTVPPERIRYRIVLRLCQ